jgi:hypothetical protein
MTLASMPRPLFPLELEDVQSAGLMLLSQMHDIVFHNGQPGDNTSFDYAGEDETVCLVQEFVDRIGTAVDEAKATLAHYRWLKSSRLLRDGLTGIFLDPTRRFSFLEVAAAAATAYVSVHNMAREGDLLDAWGGRHAALCPMPGFEIERLEGNYFESPTPDTWFEGDPMLLIDLRCIGCGIELQTDDTGEKF